MTVWKLVLFAAALLFASVIDCRTKTVPWYIHLLLGGVGLLEVSVSSVWGLAETFLMVFLIDLACKSAVGGGDVKLCGMCGFVLGRSYGLPGFLLAQLLFLVWHLFYRNVQLRRGKQISTQIPFVPFLSVSYLSLAMLQLL